MCGNCVYKISSIRLNEFEEFFSMTITKKMVKNQQNEGEKKEWHKLEN